jgi:hypothetical protein
MGPYPIKPIAERGVGLVPEFYTNFTGGKQLFCIFDSRKPPSAKPVALLRRCVRSFLSSFDLSTYFANPALTPKYLDKSHKIKKNETT